MLLPSKISQDPTHWLEMLLITMVTQRLLQEAHWSFVLIYRAFTFHCGRTDWWMDGSASTVEKLDSLYLSRWHCDNHCFKAQIQFLPVQVQSDVTRGWNPDRRQNETDVWISHVYSMCGHHSLLFLLALAVKPTVIDVGIYVNSIGPVSSIDMVSTAASSSRPHTHLSAVWH